MHMLISSLSGHESNVNKQLFAENCASLNLSASPKAHWKHLLSHARCWVECDIQGVYTTQRTLKTCGRQEQMQKQRSREARVLEKKQKNREAKSAKSEKQRSREARKQKNRKAVKQRSRKAESKAEKQKNRKMQ